MTIQVGSHFHEVWSGPPHFTDRLCHIGACFGWKAKALFCLCQNCLSSILAYPIRPLFVWPWIWCLSFAVFSYLSTKNKHIIILIRIASPRCIHRSSLKHTYIILTPLKPQFYIVCGVYRGIHYFFLLLLKNRDWAEIWKISEFFIRKFSVFGGEIFYIFE